MTLSVSELREKILTAGIIKLFVFGAALVGAVALFGLSLFEKSVLRLFTSDTYEIIDRYSAEQPLALPTGEIIHAGNAAKWCSTDANAKAPPQIAIRNLPQPPLPAGPAKKGRPKSDALTVLVLSLSVGPTTRDISFSVPGNKVYAAVLDSADSMYPKHLCFNDELRRIDISQLEQWNDGKRRTIALVIDGPVTRLEVTGLRPQIEKIASLIAWGGAGAAGLTLFLISLMALSVWSVADARNRISSIAENHARHEDHLKRIGDTNIRQDEHLKHIGETNARQDEQLRQLSDRLEPQISVIKDIVLAWANGAARRPHREEPDIQATIQAAQAASEWVDPMSREGAARHRGLLAESVFNLSGSQES